MIVPVMAISNLVLTQQIYSEETNGAHAHYREPVPLKSKCNPHGSNLLVMMLHSCYFFGLIPFLFLISRYLMGEEGYCLTTLVTALAYLATLKPT